MTCAPCGLNIDSRSKERGADEIELPRAGCRQRVRPIRACSTHYRNPSDDPEIRRQIDASLVASPPVAPNQLQYVPSLAMGITVLPTIGIALGGGGARGLAHIVMLEALDELGIRPAVVAGTSIGAVIGVLYAGGLSAAEIKKQIRYLTARPDSFEKAFKEKRLFGWFDFIDLRIGRNSIFRIDRFLDHIEDTLGVSKLEDLPMPLKVVATDFWGHQQVVLEAGPIEEAIAASFAIPGIFKPIIKDGRVLVDGGMVNPVPYDLLQSECDIVIAIDVITPRERKGDLHPSFTDSVFNAFQIAEKTIVRQKIATQPPTIYVEPHIEGVLALEFHKAEKIYAQAAHAKTELKHELESLLEPIS